MSLVDGRECVWEREREREWERYLIRWQRFSSRCVTSFCNRSLYSNAQTHTNTQTLTQTPHKTKTEHTIVWGLSICQGTRGRCQKGSWCRGRWEGRMWVQTMPMCVWQSCLWTGKDEEWGEDSWNLTHLIRYPSFSSVSLFHPFLSSPFARDSLLQPFPLLPSFSLCFSLTHRTCVELS